MSDWRPMEDAPRDGTQLLLCGDGQEIFIGHWGRAGRFTSSVYAWMGHEWGYHDHKDMIGWMPLPEPPQ